MSKQALADLLRHFPTWGDAALHYQERVERVSRVLLDVEGLLLAYWTDIPEVEIQRVLPQIRDALGDYEPKVAPPPAPKPERKDGDG